MDNDENIENITDDAKAIADAGVPNEKEMREAQPPKPKTLEELISAIQKLVDRPHDYGTCVYAVSHAALAAFNFVASQLGVTGFQASAADLDILRHTRSWEWGKILDYDKLLYPQYLTDAYFPSWSTLLTSERSILAEKATALLVKNPEAHSNVVAHWTALAKGGVA